MAMNSVYIKMCKKVMLLAAVLLLPLVGKAQRVSVGTNLVYDASLTPNLTLEARVDSSWTLGVSGGFRPWPDNDEAARKYRHVSIDIFGRKWTAGTPWRGYFYGFDALWVHYNLSNLNLHYFGMFEDARHHRIQGDLVGAGSFGGYAWNLGKGFGLDIQAGADITWAHYRKYDCVHCGAPVARRNKVYLLPKAAVDLVYSF